MLLISYLQCITCIAVTNCAGCVHCALPWAQPCGRLAPCKSAILPICLACLLAAGGYVLPHPEPPLCFRSPYRGAGSGTRQRPKSCAIIASTGAISGLFIFCRHHSIISRYGHMDKINDPPISSIKKSPISLISGIMITNSVKSLIGLRQAKHHQHTTVTCCFP